VSALAVHRSSDVQNRSLYTLVAWGVSGGLSGSSWAEVPSAGIRQVRISLSEPPERTVYADADSEESGGVGSSAREITPRLWPVRESSFLVVKGFQMAIVESEEPDKRSPGGEVELGVAERGGRYKRHLTKSVWPLVNRRRRARVWTSKHRIFLSHEEVYSRRGAVGVW